MKFRGPIILALVFALAGCVAESAYLGRREDVRRERECREPENRMKDLRAFELKSDAQKGERLFQEGILCGGMYALHAIPELPAKSEEFYETCQKVADMIKQQQPLPK